MSTNWIEDVAQLLNIDADTIREKNPGKEKNISYAEFLKIANAVEQQDSALLRSLLGLHTVQEQDISTRVGTVPRTPVLPGTPAASAASAATNSDTAEPEIGDTVQVDTLAGRAPARVTAKTSTGYRVADPDNPSRMFDVSDDEVHSADEEDQTS